MSADHSLTGKGKIRPARVWAAKRRAPKARGGALTLPLDALLSFSDELKGTRPFAIHRLMLQGCSVEALGASKAFSRWWAKHSDDDRRVFFITLSGGSDPEGIFSKSAVLASAPGHLDLPVQDLEKVEQDDAELSHEDSFKAAFRELRGSIDPDLKLEF